VATKYVLRIFFPLQSSHPEKVFGNTLSPISCGVSCQLKVLVSANKHIACLNGSKSLQWIISAMDVGNGGNV
jgi:hypothetical protein